MRFIKKELMRIMENTYQAARQKRIKNCLKLLKKEGETGIKLDKFISLLMFNYGYSKDKIQEYMEVLQQVEAIIIQEDMVRAK